MLFFSSAWALSATACTFVGNKIGANNVTKAKEVNSLIKKFTTASILIAFIVFMLTRKFYVELFTSDTRIQELAMSASPIMAVGIFFDHWQFMCNGVIKALGLQDEAVKYYLISFWVISLSLAIWLGFYTSLGYYGIRFAILAAQIFLFFNFTFMVDNADWEKAAV